MTKYILHGGYTRKTSIHNRNFFKKILNSSKNGEILVIYFARPKSVWKKLLENDREKFDQIVGKRHFELILASIDMRIFKKQVSTVKAIYIRGGKDNLLQRRLKGIKNDLPKLFSGKTIAGSSAGADLISKYYYSTDTCKIETGFGILPIKAYTHYKSDSKNLIKLRKYKEPLKTYAIPETKFIVLNS